MRPTYEPRIPPVVLDSERQEVLLEALNGIGLWLDGQSALHFGLVPVRHQVPGRPAVGADPREAPDSAAPPDRLHQLRHLLVRAEDNYSCRQRGKINHNHHYRALNRTKSQLDLFFRNIL